MRLEPVENLSMVTIVDDGDAGWASSPGFASKSSLGGYGGESRFSWPGNGSEWTSWTFAVTPGQSYRLSTTWAAYANRATDARYEIFVDGKLVGSKSLNQRLAPSDFLEDSSMWSDLANGLVVDGTSLVVRVRNSSTGVVGTDAMRLEPLTASRSSQAATTVVDDGDAGWAGLGFASKSGLGGYEGDSRFSWAGNGSEWASWTFDVTAGETYQLAATWKAAANRASNTKFYIVVDGVIIRSSQVNQQLNPNDAEYGGAFWEYLGGVIKARGSTLVVYVNNFANGVVGADAIRLDQIV
jgi:hypothetical protein